MSKPNDLIDVDYILWLVEQRKKINSFDLTECRFIKDGKILEIDKEIIEEFQLCGLSNVDFFTGKYYNK